MPAKRGPLRFVIMAATGQDVSRCAACQCCYVDEDLEAEFDLDFWEVMASARDNDEAALANKTIWALVEAQLNGLHCPNGLDLAMVARVLCREARLRGLAPGQGEEDPERGV